MTHADRWLPRDEAVDLDNCDREPIHIPGSIQAYGALFTTDRDGRVLQCSGNTTAWFGVAPEQVLGASIGATLGPEVEPLLAAALAGGSEVQHRRVSLGGVDHDLMAHAIDRTHVIVEAERAESPESLLDLGFVVDRVLETLRKSSNLDELYAALPSRIREAVGYDRVMLYLFEDGGHGTVVGEARPPESRPFLGLRFPASDIPKQARRLYAANTVRIVADSHASPVPVIPPLRPDGSPLDMSHAQTRAVSPIHLEYLRNMGVRASCSASVLTGNRLAGLIACHHGSPRYLSFARRTALSAIARAVSTRFEQLQERKERFAEVARQGAQVVFLRHFVVSAEAKVAVEEASEDALRMVDADAFVAVLPEGAVRAGQGSLASDWEPAVRALARDAREPIVTDAFSTHYPALVTGLDEPPGGILLIPIEGGALAWLRRQETQRVEWAGAPPQKNGDQPFLSPRKSFERWTQTLHGRSRPWHPDEVEIAHVLQRAAQQRLASGPDAPRDIDAILSAMAKYIQQLEHTNRHLFRSNEDLEQFAFAASHDLQSPLRTIHSYLDLIELNLKDEQGELPTSLASFWPPILDGVHRMRGLLSGLLEYARLGHAEPRAVPVDLNEVMETVERDVAALTMEVGGRITSGPLPVVRGNAAQLRRLLQNLVENALKYHRPDVPIEVQVTATPQGPRWEIAVVDNGRGIPASLQSRVFEMFRRAHADAAPGGGVGLALAKRIVERHRGTLTLQSEEGQGSRFAFTLFDVDAAPESLFSQTELDGGGVGGS